MQIPKVYWDRTGARVLTMEYEDGCLATDVEEMRRQVATHVAKLNAQTYAAETRWTDLCRFWHRAVINECFYLCHVAMQKLPLDKVARLITRVFSEQVRLLSDTHQIHDTGRLTPWRRIVLRYPCTGVLVRVGALRPSPRQRANPAQPQVSLLIPPHSTLLHLCELSDLLLLVCRRPGEPVMILLDHGLYKQLDDDFRLDYCRLWKVRQALVSTLDATLLSTPLSTHVASP